MSSSAQRRSVAAQESSADSARCAATSLGSRCARLCRAMERELVYVFMSSILLLTELHASSKSTVSSRYASKVDFCDEDEDEDEDSIESMVAC